MAKIIAIQGRPTMSEDPKAPNAEEPEVIRKPFVPMVETDTDDGSRSPRNDRPLDVNNLVETTDAAEVIRKPIVIDAQPEA